MSENAQSQTLKAILGLRGLIVDGELRPGERVSETLVTERFGVSRTPARMALVQMSDEGLLSLDSLFATPAVWSNAMHSTTWAVALTGRTAAAAAAQLDLVRCLAGRPIGADDLMRGLWNHLSAAVQAHVVADLVDGDTWEVLCGDVLDAV